MALLRNISGVRKLGLADPDFDMSRNLPGDEGGGGGGGSYYQPVYPQEPVPPADPMPKDYGGGGGAPMPPSFYQPDDTGNDTTGPDPQQPVYPILPIEGYEEVPPAEPVPDNTVSLTDIDKKPAADLAALGVLSALFFMILTGKPKGAMGGIVYAGGLGVLYLRLKNVQTVQVQPTNVQ